MFLTPLVGGSGRAQGSCHPPPPDPAGLRDAVPCSPQPKDRKREPEKWQWC